MWCRSKITSFFLRSSELSKPKKFELPPDLEKYLLTFLDKESLANYAFTNKHNREKVRRLINSILDAKEPDLPHIKSMLFSNLTRTALARIDLEHISLCQNVFQKELELPLIFKILFYMRNKIAFLLQAINIIRVLSAIERFESLLPERELSIGIALFYMAQRGLVNFVLERIENRYDPEKVEFVHLKPTTQELLRKLFPNLRPTSNGIPDLLRWKKRKLENVEKWNPSLRYGFNLFQRNIYCEKRKPEQRPSYALVPQ